MVSDRIALITGDTVLYDVRGIRWKNARQSYKVPKLQLPLEPYLDFEYILRQKCNVNPITISSHGLHTKWGEFKVSLTTVFLQAFLLVSLNHKIILIQKTF